MLGNMWDDLLRLRDQVMSRWADLLIRWQQDRAGSG
jgi:hypothetical protein